ncbi:hypothetical protein HOG21_06440 [bacterium]|jgi:hypothetical protein|nr:hypothetical protein [bacterium]
MLEIDYNQKFRTFFKKFEEKYKKATTKDEKDFLWDLAVEYIEKNRDFIMQYPLASYWNKIDLPLAPSLIRSGNNKDTSQKEVKNFLEEYNNKDVNLYFHIPFCKTKCSYCNFHIVV